MNIAILSDIHGNLIAFERVLADIERAGVGQIVCLGDVAFGGPHPREVARRLKELNCPVVMGNTDQFFVNVPTPDSSSESDLRIMDWIMWTIPQFTRADIEFIKSFQPRVEIPLPRNKKLLCFHGSPQANTEIILATTPDADVARMLGDDRAAVMAGGHTHTQMLRRFQQSILMNPGSIGMPIQRDVQGKQTRPPFAEYAVLAAEGDDLRVEFRRVAVDVGAIVRALRESGMPHAERLAQEWEEKG
ncbi:MAG: metallophosphoesterase family protein [Chloroflexi bacterium]|nr:metallophosphoesterase family protein [Chloroflexota bacterium]